MPAPTITPLPTPPARTSPGNFSERADAFLGALPSFQSQLNALGTYLDGVSATAVGAATDAETRRAAAATSAANAATSATNAAGSATAAAGSATTANTHRTAAATSATNAATSESNAATSATNANTRATAAETARAAAVTAETNAKTSETNAKTSETNAKTSETNAAGSATAAAGSASSAAGSATAASNSAASAAGAASTATGAATSASTSASAAATARTGAEAALNTFNGKWYGSRATAPTGTIDNGALYFNTTVGGLMIRKDGAWIGAVAASFDELFALLKNSDGHNSGLDADLLDGKHASRFPDLESQAWQAFAGPVRVIDDLQATAKDAAAPDVMLSFRDETELMQANLYWERTSNIVALRNRQTNGSWNALWLTNDGELRLNGSPIKSEAQNPIYQGSVGVGSLAFLYNTGTGVGFGGTLPGSQLRLTNVSSTGAVWTGGAVQAGTWRCLGTVGQNQATLFVRIL